MDSSPKRKKKIKEITQGISKEELIRRLKAAAQELTNVDQGDDTSDYNEFAASVATPFILNHKDKDVKSFAACCLADVLRIYAPEPPYNEEDLKDILRMIVHQLKCLENVQGPSYKRHFYILESLALVKTFNVCIELDAQDLILDLFKCFFTIVSDQHNIRVKTFMLDVMCPLIQEGDTVPQELLDVILMSLIDPRKTKCPEAYKLAHRLLDRCSSSIEPYIQLFFNNTIVLGNAANSELDDNLYELLYELYKINKSVLLSVLPQLEFKLKGNDENERLQTVKLLGRMFADEETSLAESNKPLWNCYLGRFLDVAPSVRLECVQMAKQFLLSSIGILRADITEQLVNRLQDPDEKVRLETVVAICDSALENFDLIHVKLFDGVVGRIRDKKWLIRREAVTCLGKLYKRMLSLPTNSGSKISKKSIKKLKDVPSKILHLYFQNSIEDRLCVERVVHGCLIPVTLPVEDRMKRLFNFYHSLDEAGINVFEGMLKHRSRVNKDFTALLEAYTSDCDKDEKETLVFTQTVALARNLPEPHKAQEHITKLLTMCKNKKLYEHLSKASSLKEECPKIIKSVTEVIKTITTKSPIIETVKALLDRACPMILDSSSFTYLLKNIKDYIDEYGDDEEEDDNDISLKGKCGLKLVELLATVQPSLFQTKACYEILMLFLTNDDREIVERTLSILQNVMTEIEEVDKALSGSFQPVLTKLITQGSCKQAKYSVRCLKMLTKSSSTVLERLIKNLLDKLNFKVSSQQLRCTLAALAELALLAPAIFEANHTKVITDFAVKQILLVDKEKTSKARESDDEWGPESSISDETLTKIEAIKLLTRWLLGMVNKHTENGKPVLRLLTTLLNNDGDLQNEGKISAKNRSHLRLAASLGLLKIVQNTKYVDVITLEQYQQLALVVQDSCYEIREKFTLKLHIALNSLKLSLDYLAFLVLVAVDPSKERRAKVKQMIAKNAHTRREYSKLNSAAASRPYAILPEYSLPYVVHLLAHHPDFNHTDTDSLNQAKDYLWFFLEPIMGVKAENYSFLKKLLENIKLTRDQQNPDDKLTNEKMYTVCDIAVGCILNKNTTFTLKDFPGSLVLPRKLFLPDKTLNNTKIYIPQGFFAAQKNKTILEGSKAAPKRKEKNNNENYKNGNGKSNSNVKKVKDDVIEKRKSPPKKRSRGKAAYESESEEEEGIEDEFDENFEDKDTEYKVVGTRSRPAAKKQATMDRYLNGNSKKSRGKKGKKVDSSSEEENDHSDDKDHDDSSGELPPPSSMETTDGIVSSSEQKLQVKRRGNRRR